MSSYYYLQRESAQNDTGLTNRWLTSRANHNTFKHNYSDWNLYQEHADDKEYRSLLGIDKATSPVSKLFFSKANIAHLKKLICQKVYEQSKQRYKIDPHAQSSDELLMVMRSLYLQHTKDLPGNIREQAAELNYLVLLDLVPRVLSNVQMNLTYLRNASKQPLQLDRPENVSNAGTRVNRSVTSVFF